MEREILFRGKRLDNGEWVEGMLCQFHEGISAKIAQNDFGTFESSIAWVVDPSTVGQYTGLTDKNGVKIFEGDIIKTKKFGKIVGHTNVNDFDFFVVSYEDQMFRLLTKNRGFNLIDDGYSKFEVIGNIHDNPELMKGNKNE